MVNASEFLDQKFGDDELDAARQFAKDLLNEINLRRRDELLAHRKASAQLLCNIFGVDYEDDPVAVTTSNFADFTPHPHSMKLGRLRQFLEDHPELDDDAPFLIERIEDVYFEKYGWHGVTYHFAGEAGPQTFFEPHCPTIKDGMVLIHAHY